MKNLTPSTVIGATVIGQKISRSSEIFGKFYKKMKPKILFRPKYPKIFVLEALGSQLHTHSSQARRSKLTRWRHCVRGQPQALTVSKDKINILRFLDVEGGRHDSV